jgi:putative ABC transport system permease protein
MATLIQDLRYGIRMLAKSPGFTAVAVLTLALGIGANTAIFTLVNAVMLKSLPVAHPQQLVLLRWESPHATTDSLPYPTFSELRDGNSNFAGMFAFHDLELATSVEGKAGVAGGELVSGNFFSILGVSVAAGRTFTAEEDRTPGRNAVAIISYEYWRRQFGLDRSVVGKPITLNGVPFNIIGVAARGFDGVSLGDRQDIWIPMMMQAQVMDGRSLLNDPNGWFFQIMARRKVGISDQQAEASLNVLYQRIARQESGVKLTPQAAQELTSQRIVLLPASKGVSSFRDRFSKPLLLLMALVGLVLLVACANVANLVLARASVRQKEFALRAALGASRWRLLRQMLTESLLLAGLGGVTGFLLAVWGDNLLLSLPWNNGAPLPITLRPDATMLVFTASLALLTAALFGIAPAWNSAKLDLNSALKASGGRVAAGSDNRHTRWGLRGPLVICEVAISLVLMVGAGIFIRSLLKLMGASPGFDRNNVLLVWVDPTLVGFRGNPLINVYERFADAMRTLPGVQSVSLSALPPMTRSQWLTGVFAEGRAPGANENTTARWNLVSPGYFRTLDIPLLLGRDFTPQDNAAAPQVAIINEAMARFYFGSASAVGKRLSFISPERGEIEIIGVVRNAKYGSFRESTPHMLYLPYLQTPPASWSFGMALEIRTTGNPDNLVGAVRQAIRGVERDVPASGFITLADEVNNSFAQEREVAQLSSFFGIVGLLLGCVGLYGVMSYSVAQRTHEIGIRMALGAQREDVLRHVIGQGLRLTLIGVGVGIAGALGLTRFLSSLLYGVNPTDPLTFIAVPLILTAVALLASYIPARRATQVDPIVALRYE